MSTHSQCLRIFKMIGDLSHSHGITVEEACDKYGISRQVFIKDKNLIDELIYPGFISKEPVVGEKYFRYCIKKDGEIMKDTFLTQEEERQLMALISKEDPNDFSEIRKKLFMFSHNEVMKLANTLTHRVEIAYAIKHQKIINLIKYEAPFLNNIQDYKVEPIDLFDNNKRLYALDIEDNICKTFKIDRISSLTVTKDSVSHFDFYQPKFHDAFGWSCAESETLHVAFDMSRLAGNMLIENYPDTKAQRISVDNDQFPYRFKAEVARYQGVGRFVLSLPGHIDNIQDQDFLNYLQESKKKYLF
ncbi:helix-turn-helix transcriptional regulator [Aureibacter tunicatorum]|uniref:DNA-binding transcriptional regulator YafY n=1 Tax=Aureibacter tunicatorum TaxID=866807 RepID=A0AAE3XRR6_9BACT|nr:WYL domain-containing protein [Aureibacter tunicatorum]MDR6241937.1 putative DNA-binding transcriptional regulator YafY [Aureibacter tunicatorum]